MAYLHCHKCHWSQDDFWDFSLRRYGYWTLPFIKIGWSYNPFSVFLSYVFTKRGYWFPRRIMHDKYCMKDCGWKRPDPHSWWLIGYEFKKIFKGFKRQKWWTEKAFRKDVELKIAHCPKCGNSKNFDID